MAKKIQKKQLEIGTIRIMSSLLLLAAGGVVYLLYRPTTLLLFRGISWMGQDETVDRWRAAMACELPDIMVYSLPAGLWSASYVIFVDTLIGDRPWLVRLLTASIIPLTGAASEVLQALGALQGTFDWADLLCYLLPLAVFLGYPRFAAILGRCAPLDLRSLATEGTQENLSKI